MLKQFLNKLSSYLEFSTFERRGVYSLLFILLLVSGYNYYNNTKAYKLVRVDDAKLALLQENMVRSLEKKQRVKLRREITQNNNLSRESKFKPILTFDPNTDSFEVLVGKGLRPSVAKNIVSYREKVSAFKDVKDLKKLYSIDTAYYVYIKDYVVIKTTKLSAPTAKYANDSLSSQPTEIKTIELNSATSEQLQLISGIGPSYAKWILDYRSKLGGFVSKDQLLEVYRFDQEKLNQVSSYLNINLAEVERLSINTATVSQLANHPYISYNQAKSIISYRQEHGSFTSVQDLAKLYLFHQEDIGRLLLYLDVN